MKRIISAVACALILVCALTSCGKTTTANSSSLTDVYASLENVTNMPSMELMPDDLIETLFGFDLSKFEEYVFAEASDPSVNADTVILIKLRDSADMTETCTVLDGYLQSVKDNTQSYSPVNFAKTRSSAVSVIGSNYVYLIITSEYSEAEQIVINALPNSSANAVETIIG